MFFLFLLIIIVALKRTGGGYRPGLLGGGTGPWTWTEIYEKFLLHLSIATILTLIFAYLDYWDYKKKKDKQN